MPAVLTPRCACASREAESDWKPDVSLLPPGAEVHVHKVRSMYTVHFTSDHDCSTSEPYAGATPSDTGLYASTAPGLSRWNRSGVTVQASCPTFEQGFGCPAASFRTRSYPHRCRGKTYFTAVAATLVARSAKGCLSALVARRAKGYLAALPALLAVALTAAATRSPQD